MKKFKAEGNLEEIKKVLGWTINTRRLLISLPDDKLHSWSSDIQQMISSKKASHKSLESTLGRLNQVAGILNPMRHYMGRLYQALYRSSTSHGWTKLTVEELSDLRMMLSFLSAAHQGLPMNNLVFR